MPLATVIVELIVTLLTEAPELVAKIQEIHKSTTMTPEEKQAAYAELRVKYAATVTAVQNAQL